MVVPFAAMATDDGLLIDFASPAVQYWTRALERIEERRRAIVGTSEAAELTWNQLAELSRLEELVRCCLDAAEKETLQSSPS